MFSFLSFFIFISLFGTFVVLVLVFLSGLSSVAYRTAFFRSLLRKIFCLPTRIICGCLLFVIFLVFVFCFLDSLLNPFLPTMSFAGCFLRFFFFSPTVVIPGLFCFGSVYLATTAGFVVDPLSEMNNNNNVCSFDLYLFF